MPGLRKKMPAEVLKSQLTMEHDRKLERERLFLMYSKQWWNEYLSLREGHSERLVKIFTEVRYRGGCGDGVKSGGIVRQFLY